MGEGSAKKPGRTSSPRKKASRKKAPGKKTGKKTGKAAPRPAAGETAPAKRTPASPEALPEGAPEAAPGERPVPEPITIEIDRQLERLEEALERAREEVGYWARKGIYTRVRFRFRGRQILPDIPVAAFLAAEAATFWWSGLLRALAVNVGGGALFDVELISDAEPHLARAQEHLLAGDVDDALAEFGRALDIDRDLPAGHLGVGTCLKLRGDRAGALAAFRRARALDPRGETGRQAQVQVEKLERS